MNQLEVNSLAFERNGFILQTSFSLERGTTGVILGPSGCGKTTLLRCIAGLEQQTGGQIFLNGREIGNLPPEKRNIGFVFQDLALFDHLSGRGNISFGLQLKNIPQSEAKVRIAALAEKLQISALLDRKPFSMSGGERQRLAFARALANQPDLLLLDEPLSSLDAPLRRELRAYLRATLSREGITALHVTHDVEEALELGDKIFLMNMGRILVSGNPKTIYENPPDAWCARFLGLGSLLPIKTIEVLGDRVIANTDSGSFFCPASNCSANAGTLAGKNLYLFFTRRAAVIYRTLEADGNTTKGKNLIEAVVERTVFLGNTFKVVLRPLPSGEKFFNDEISAAYTILETENDSFPTFSPGEKVRLAIDPSLCRILPFHV